MLLFPFHPWCTRREAVRKGGENSPVGGLEWKLEEGDACKTEPGTEDDVEHEDADVAGGVTTRDFPGTSMKNSRCQR